MRIATFNVENMFERARAMNLDTWAAGKGILEDFARLNTLIQEPEYTPDISSELLELMQRNKGLLTTGKSQYICLRDPRGDLVRKSGGKYSIAATGRAAWIGWFELLKEPVKQTATENTARIIGLLQADVLAVVEAESRLCLKRFNDGVLGGLGLEPFAHVMLIDGNDDRGIDVGLMTRPAYEIARIVSHVDDRDDRGIVFSRDCAEYEIATAQGNTLLVLVNHFKSKGYGGAAASTARRLRQAERVRAIYDQRIRQGYEYVAVVGDLNDTPDSTALDPLVTGSMLTDVMAHPEFEGDGRPGTHGNGTKSAKFDYILMSPRLCSRVIRGGVERRGVWGGKNGTLFPHLPTMKSAVDAASDHAALWVDVDV